MSGIPTKHVFAKGVMIATITGSGSTSTVSSILTDHLTGSSVVTNASGTITELTDYYPYGAIRRDEQTGFNEQRKYAGHEFDASTGLSYMRARYYNGSFGRFLSEDPAFLRLSFDLTDPQSLNSYAYARNNPLAYIDPDGESFRSSFALGFRNEGIGILNWLSQPTPSVVGQFVKGALYDTPRSFIESVYITDSYSSNITGAINGLGSLNTEQKADALGYVAGQLTTQVGFSVAVGSAASLGSSAIGSVGSSPKISSPYKRPPNATTNQQREYVNSGNPQCATCGKTGEKMFADHKDPLVKEYYRTNAIDMSRARDVSSVQPQCQACSSRQGAALRQYSMEERKKHFGK